MDIKVKAEEMLRFLKRCNVSGLIKDLIFQTDGESLVARFATKERYMYGEVYIPSVVVKEQGTLSVPRIKALIDVTARLDDGLIRIVTSESADVPSFALTNGKANVKLMQIDDAGICESNDSIPEDKVMFDKDTLQFAGGAVEYKNGCEIEYGMLNEILKDASAFNYERYEFKVKTTKTGTQLVCSIVNEHTNEKFTRVVADGGFIGDVGKIPSVIVGGGFKEIIKTIVSSPEPLDEAKKDQQPRIKMYFDAMSVLITDGRTFFYNLNTYDEKE